jgi:NAD binding domain of 6-phosphogluconate dehydrogenase
VILHPNEFARKFGQSKCEQKMRGFLRAWTPVCAQEQLPEWTKTIRRRSPTSTRSCQPKSFVWKGETPMRCVYTKRPFDPPTAKPFVQNEGLGLVLAARFYAARGFERIANACLRDARNCYLRWGAEGKVRQLDRLYPHLKEATLPSDPTSTILSPVEHLDLATVIKVSRAVSGELVFLFLPGPVQIEEVVLGRDGVAAHMRTGLVLFDLSTSSRELALRVDAELRSKGGTFFDAPISGGPAGAASGDIPILSGGSPHGNSPFTPR